MWREDRGREPQTPWIPGLLASSTSVGPGPECQALLLHFATINTRIWASEPSASLLLGFHSALRDLRRLLADRETTPCSCFILTVDTELAQRRCSVRRHQLGVPWPFCIPAIAASWFVCCRRHLACQSPPNHQIVIILYHQVCSSKKKVAE